MEAKLKVARAYLEKVSRRMKNFADLKLGPLEFQVGDQVLIKLRLVQFRLRGEGIGDQRLVWKYEGPVKVIEKFGRTSYRLQLPTWMKIHLVIHVSNLKPYHPDDDDHQHNEVTPYLVKSAY